MVIWRSNRINVIWELDLGHQKSQMRLKIDVEEITKKIRELKITKQDCLQDDKRQFALSDLQSAVGLARRAVQMLTPSMESVRHN